MGKMVKRNTAALCAALFTVLLVMAGCSNPYTLTEKLTGTTVVTLSINGVNGVRTIMPEIAAFDTLTVTFNLRGNSNAKIERTWTGGKSTDTESLDPGIWDINVKAFMDDAMESESPIEEGEATITVGTGGGSQEVVIYLEPVGGTGTFSWDISVDSGIAVAMTVTRLNVNGTVVAGNGAYSDTFNLVSNNQNDSMELNAGFYRVVFTLTRDEESVEWRELMYVYTNMESAYTQTFNCTLFPSTLLNLVLTAIATNSYTGVTASHFEMLGVQGVTVGNFNAIKAAFVMLGDSGVPADDAGLRTISDAALVSIGKSGIEVNSYSDLDAAKAAIAALVKNGSTSAFTRDGNTITVTIGSYTVELTVNITLNTEAINITVDFTQIKDPAANIITGPALSLTNVASKSALVTVEAETGMYINVYRWYVNNRILNGENTSSLTLSVNDYPNVGSYSLTVEVNVDGKWFNQTLTFTVGL